MTNCAPLFCSVIGISLEKRPETEECLTVIVLPSGTWMFILPDVLSAFRDDGTMELFIVVDPERLLAFTVSNAPDRFIDPDVVSAFTPAAPDWLSSVIFPEMLSSFMLS